MQEVTFDFIISLLLVHESYVFESSQGRDPKKITFACQSIVLAEFLSLSLCVCSFSKNWFILWQIFALELRN